MTDGTFDNLTVNNSLVANGIIYPNSGILNNGLDIDGWIWFRPDDDQEPAKGVFLIRDSANSFPEILRIRRDGRLVWLGDTNLYRSAPNVLKTDNSFALGKDKNSFIFVNRWSSGFEGFPIKAEDSACKFVAFQDNTGTNRFVVRLDSYSIELGDTSLSRTAGAADAPNGIALRMGPSSSLDFHRAVATDKIIATFTSGDNANRFTIDGKGRLEWGDGAGTRDTTLYRGEEGNVLKTEDNFVVGADLYLPLGHTVFFDGSSGGTPGTNLGFLNWRDNNSGNKILSMKGIYDNDSAYKFQYYYWNGSTWNCLATLNEHGQLSVAGGIESLEYWQHLNPQAFMDAIYSHTFADTTGKIKFSDLNGTNYILLHGVMSDGNPNLVCSQHLAVEKDFLVKGMLDSLEGEVALNGGNYGPGWGPYTRNPFIWLAQQNYGTLEIRKKVANGTGDWDHNMEYQVWGWGSLQCGVLSTVGNLSIGHLETSSYIPLYLDAYGVVSRSSSTIRGKENVRELPDCSWLYDLRPVSFDWKDTERAKLEGTQIGLIAEEVYGVCPNLTWLDKEGKPEGVHYEWLGVPLLVEIKKLRNRVEALENQLKQNQTAA